jgi:hypothetical protein
VAGRASPASRQRGEAEQKDVFSTPEKIQSARNVFAFPAKPGHCHAPIQPLTPRVTKSCKARSIFLAAAGDKKRQIGRPFKIPPMHYLRRGFFPEHREAF